MDIESLETKLVKSSKVEDGDIIIIKVNPNDKDSFNKETIHKLYSQIKQMLGNKNVAIYFFPKNLDIDFIKTNIQNIESNKENIDNQIKQEINEN